MCRPWFSVILTSLSKKKYNHTTPHHTITTLMYPPMFSPKSDLKKFINIYCNLKSNLEHMDRKQHKCTVKGCKAAFSRPWKLEAHERKHTGERPFVCDIDDCTKSYTNNSHLQRHKQTHHDGLKKSQELLCKYEGCGRVLSNKYALNKHNNRCHNSDTFPFKCAECMDGFKRKGELREHLANHTGRTPFQCTICPESFIKYHLYMKHMRYHRTYECDCGIVFERWTQICEHRRTSCKIKKEHKCIICEKVLSSATNLKQHALNKHVGESQKDVYFCPYLNCKRSYTLKKNLTQHIRVLHEKDNIEKAEVFNCSEPNCDVVLKNKKNLKQHIRVVHKKLPANKKQRRPRKDKGIPKIPMVTVVTGLEACPDKIPRILDESSTKFKRKHTEEDPSTVTKKKLKISGELADENSTSSIESTEISSDKNESEIDNLSLECEESYTLNECSIEATEESDNEDEVQMLNPKLYEAPTSDCNNAPLICDTDLLRQCDQVINTLNEQLRSNPRDELTY